MRVVFLEIVKDRKRKFEYNLWKMFMKFVRKNDPEWSFISRKCWQSVYSTTKKMAKDVPLLLGFQSTLKGIRSAIANDFQARDVRFTTKTLTPVQEFKHFFKSSRPKFELLTLLCHFKTRCELTQRYTRLNNYQPTFSP